MRIHGWIAVAAAALGVGPGAAATPPAEPYVMSGFVDAGYAGNFDRRDDAFGLNEAELDVTRGQGDDLLLRADLEWVRDGETWNAAAEQGFLAWRLPCRRPVTFTLGKFNAPLGWELLDPPDMYQYSHGLLFTYCAPTNLTGAMLAGTLGRGCDLKGYVVNGWDQNAERNGVKTWGGRFGYGGPGGNAVGVSLISGRDDPAQALDRTVVDVDLTLQPASRLLLGAEFNHGRLAHGATTANWTGVMAMAHLRTGERLGFTGRCDLLDDTDDALLGFGRPTRRTSFTFAPTVALEEGLRALVEVRLDAANRAVFAAHDGSPRRSTASAAFTMTCRF